MILLCVCKILFLNALKSLPSRQVTFDYKWVLTLFSLNNAEREAEELIDICLTENCVTGVTAPQTSSILRIYRSAPSHFSHILSPGLPIYNNIVAIL